MGDNPYDTDPLWVAVVDPHSGRYLQAFFFLGNAPRKVLAAARRGRPARGDPRRFEWSGDDAEALRGYYGRGYASKLNAEDPPRMRAANALLANRLRFFTGGAAAGGPTAAGSTAGSEASGGDEPPPSSDFDVFDEVAAETADAAYALSNFDKTAAEEDEPPIAAIPRGSARPPVYTDMVILSDDTVYDLRRKIEAATEIGFYRQHFFYFVNDEGPTYPYRVSMGGVPVAVNWRGMVVPATATATATATAAEPATATAAEPTAEATAEPTAEAAPTESILGLTIDRSLEEGRTEVVVEALDTFTSVVLGGDAGTSAATGAYRINKAYIVDLFQVVDPAGSAEVLSDKYTFGLLYHGGVIKYWPQLSMEACRTALGAPREMQSRFPSLVATGARAVARFAEEARLAALARRWRPESSRGGREPLAVTAAAIRVGAAGPRTVLNVRNVFDWIPTVATGDVAGAKTAASQAAPALGPALAVLPTAASVKFDPGVGGLAGAAGTAGAAGSGGDPRRRLVQKRNLLSYSGQHAPFVEAFLAQDTPLGSVGFAIPRAVPADRLAGARPYAVAVLHASGAYEVRSAWSSDERRGLDTVVEELRELSAPLVGAVNAMGAAAFPLGGELGDAGPRDSGPRDSGPRAKRADAAAAFSGLTISAFWPDAFSAQDFKRLKAGLVDYERAGLIEARALAQGNTFSFSFLKGVTAYDRRLAQRAAAGDGGGGGNQYAWLCEPTAAARWAVSFSGRQVRFHHRATDLRVEIIGAASLAEFQRIRQYVFSYLEGMRRSAAAAAAPGAAGVAPVPPGGTASSATLRRLQERDPNLFDQKKYDQGTKVYSIVCQSKHQPTIYSPEEARSVKRKLTPYWNFTTQEPAYYSCPNPEYPHLTLRAGIHPLGYCLPCCKKTPSRTSPGSCGVPAADVRPGAADVRPSAADPGAAGTADTTPIAHVLSYSKAVPVGRMGEPPPDMTRKLLLDAVPEPYSVVLLGVEQSAPAVPDAGFVYAVAEALISAQMRTPEAVLEALAAAALRLGDGFYAAAGGAGARFSGGPEIAEALLSDFVFRREGFSKFGPGGAAEGATTALLRELVAAAWDMDIVVFGDGPAGLALAAPPGGLQHGSCIVIVQGSGGTYPAAMLDRAEAARTPFAERWMTSRRVFRRDQVRDSVADSVWERVERVVKWARSSIAAEAAGSGGATLEETIAAVPSLFPAEATTLLIDMRGRCYAALVASGKEGTVYVPVSHSPPLPGYKRHYGARPDVPLPVPLLESFVRRLRRGRLADMVPVEFAGAVIGRYESSTGLCWYHDGVAPAPAGTAAAAGPAPIRLRADPRAVDEAIVAHLKGGQRPDYADPLAVEALERNRSYERFRAEFAAVIRTQRNSALRAQLLGLISGTQFQNSESVQDLRRRLSELLKGSPADLATLRTIVSQAVLSPNVKARAAQLMEGTPFEFDRQTLARLRGLPRAAIISELREMLRGRVVPAEAAAGEAAAPPGNLYVACSEDSSVRSCSRLALPAELYDGYFELLAADIQNPSKWWLLSSSPPGVFDTMVFIRRSGEHLFVR